MAPALVVQIRARKPDERGAGGVRYGLTASGKVGNAVRRNRAKRRMRALAHEILPAHAVCGHDYVLIARASTMTAPYDTLRSHLITALKKLKAWKD